VSGSWPNLIYLPDPDYSGTDSFTVKASDGKADSEAATVSVTIQPTAAPTNNKPVADDDSASTSENTPVTIDVLDGDSDPDSGQTIKVVSVSEPTHGAAEIIDGGDDAGKVRYTPDTDYRGTDSFEYTVCDDGEPSECDTALVELTVEAVNDAPTADARGPYEVREGGTVEVGASGEDVGGGELTYQWDLDGDGTFENPGQNATFSAADLDGPSSHRLEVRVTNPEGLSTTDEATVSVTNVAPTAAFNPSSPVDEGSAFDLSLDDPSDASKPDENAGFTYAFDCGGGYGAFGPEHVASCSTDDNGTRSVRGKIRDKDGGTTEYTGSVTVNNVAPTVTGITPSPLRALVNQSVSFTGTAADPSRADTQAGFAWKWSKEWGAFEADSNPFVTSFSTCGAHSVSAKATDKDGGASADTTSTSVQVYNGNWLPPLQTGKDNLVQKGQVVPVKVSVVGCDGINLTDLNPDIRLLSGDPTPGIDEANFTVPTSVSSADSAVVMRPIDGGYIYNLQVPGGTTVKVGDKYTVRVSPFGIASGQHMAIAIQIRK
jgi:hypothetical protein